MTDSPAVPEQIPLIYVLGSGHSGSTLLDLLLGSHSDVWSSGELKSYSRWAAQPEARTCSCGEAMSSCAFWRGVTLRLGGVAFGDVNEGEGFGERNARLASAILATAGRRVLCDSSKNQQRLRRYLGSNRFSVQVVHLIRDGRAVAFSHLAKLNRVRSQFGLQHERVLASQGKDPGAYGLFRGARRWDTENRRMAAEFGQQPGYQRLRYEDLVADPAAAVAAILAGQGLAYEPAQLRFRSHPHHNLAGNRMRTGTSERIEADTRYCRQLAAFDWWLATAIALRGLRAFGYPLGRARARKARP